MSVQGFPDDDGSVNYRLELETAKQERTKFIICGDISGSMSGVGITQLRLAIQALKNALGDDSKLILFNDQITVYEGIDAILAAPVRASGGTNFDKPLTKAMGWIRSGSIDEKTIILFMSDGQATCTSYQFLEDLARKGYKVEVHIVALGESIDLRVLNNIKDAGTGGSFQLVDEKNAGNLTVAMERIATMVFGGQDEVLSVTANGTQDIGDGNFVKIKDNLYVRVPVLEYGKKARTLTVKRSTPVKVFLCDNVSPMPAKVLLWADPVDRACKILISDHSGAVVPCTPLADGEGVTLERPVIGKWTAHVLKETQTFECIEGSGTGDETKSLDTLVFQAHRAWTQAKSGATMALPTYTVGKELILLRQARQGVKAPPEPSNSHALQYVDGVIEDLDLLEGMIIAGRLSDAARLSIKDFVASNLTYARRQVGRLRTGELRVMSSRVDKNQGPIEKAFEAATRDNPVFIGVNFADGKDRALRLAPYSLQKYIASSPKVPIVFGTLVRVHAKSTMTALHTHRTLTLDFSETVGTLEDLQTQKKARTGAEQEYILGNDEEGRPYNKMIPFVPVVGTKDWQIWHAYLKPLVNFMWAEFVSDMTLWTPAMQMVPYWVLGTFAEKHPGKSIDHLLGACQLAAEMDKFDAKAYLTKFAQQAEPTRADYPSLVELYGVFVFAKATGLIKGSSDLSSESGSLHRSISRRVVENMQTGSVHATDLHRIILADRFNYELPPPPASAGLVDLARLFDIAKHVTLEIKTDPVNTLRGFLGVDVWSEPVATFDDTLDDFAEFAQRKSTSGSSVAETFRSLVRWNPCDGNPVKNFKLNAFPSTDHFPETQVLFAKLAKQHVDSTLATSRVQSFKDAESILQAAAALIQAILAENSASKKLSPSLYKTFSGKSQRFQKILDDPFDIVIDGKTHTLDLSPKQKGFSSFLSLPRPLDHSDKHNMALVDGDTKFTITINNVTSVIPVANNATPRHAYDPFHFPDKRKRSDVSTLIETLQTRTFEQYAKTDENPAKMARFFESKARHAAIQIRHVSSQIRLENLEVIIKIITLKNSGSDKYPFLDLLKEHVRNRKTHQNSHLYPPMVVKTDFI